MASSISVTVGEARPCAAARALAASVTRGAGDAGTVEDEEVELSPVLRCASVDRLVRDVRPEPETGGILEPPL